MKKELAFSNKEAAFEVAKRLIEENYVVMLSKEEDLVIINYEWSANCDRNNIIFIHEEDMTP